MLKKLILILLFIGTSFWSCEDTKDSSHPFVGLWKNTHIYQNGEWSLNEGDSIYWWEITDNTNTSIMASSEDDGSLCYSRGTENQFEPIDNGDHFTVNYLIFTIEDEMLVYKSNINSNTYAGMTKVNSFSFTPVCND